MMPIIAAAVCLIVYAFDRIQLIDWVGFTDLEIQFIVTDAATGQPVKDATISVHSEDGSLYRERDETQFALQTDQDGIARQVCHDNLCSGRQSGLGFTNTFSVALPSWYFQVSAPGYRPTEGVWLDPRKYSRQVQEVGRRATRLVVLVAIEKARTEPAPD
ncbi:MAG TPA: hypothetical protein VJ739_00695 [Gemmataceae bacterium]|nr:hypothetical protein [Gemmataceae bacterium]